MWRKAEYFSSSVVGLEAGSCGLEQSLTQTIRRAVQFQHEFQQDDPTSNLFFTNFLDKGYRCILAAWRSGGQLLLQPFFARSDRKFSSREVLLSGAVASDHSGNERAVNRLKSNNMIARGIHQTQDLPRFASFWIAWGFQCNFIFKPVL
jgi:hypothetical protein